VTAGFPCQPVSHAGKGAGVHDERWLIRDVVTVARRAGAQWIFMENVRGLLSANKGEAFGQVLDALAEGGFDARWACIRADQSVGACHRRDRWFAVAHAGGERHGGGQDGGEVGLLDGRDESQARQQQRARPEPVDRGTETATYTAGVGLGERPRSGKGEPTQQRRDGPCDSHRTAPTDADGEGLQGHGEEHQLPEAGGQEVVGWGDYGAAIQRWGHVIGRPAPAPVTDDKLSSRFVEWMMGLPDGWVTGVGLSRTQELKILGNGVVPQQAAVAYGWLLEQ